MIRYFLLAGVCLLSLMTAATAAPIGLLSDETVIDLPFTPAGVVMVADGSAIAVASTATSADVLVLDRQGVERSRYHLPHSAAAMQLTPDGRRLFVVGATDGDGFATAIDLSMPDAADALATLPMMAAPVAPSLYADDRSTLYLAEASSPLAIALPLDAFTLASLDASGTPPFDVAFYFGGGVRSLSISKLQKIALVASEGAGRLAVVSLGGANRVLDMYGRSRSGSEVPLAIAVADTQPTDTTGPSIVIASHETGELSIVDYNRTFEALDVVATAAIGHALLPNSTIHVIPDTSVIEQPMLLATSRTQDVILSANLYSRQVFQFARRGAGTAGVLERIGYFELPAAPSALAMSSAGDLAAVTLAGRSQLVLLTPAATVAEPSNPRVRELQRALTELGFDVGAVDGIGGPATNAALRVFRERTGLHFELTDTEAALAAVQGHSSGCATVALRCLRQVALMR